MTSAAQTTVLASGIETETVAVPFLPPALAIIVAEPAETALTRPAADTVATAGFELVQETL